MNDTKTALPSSSADRIKQAPAGRVVERSPGRQEQDLAGFLKRRRLADNLLRFGTPVLFLALWQLVSATGVADERFWPAPTDVFLSFGDAISSGELIDALGVSVSRILIGFVAGAVIGVLAGLVLGTIRPLRIALEPLISAIYTVPKLALLPLLLLIFGLGDLPKIILIALSVFFIVVISTTAAVVAVPESYREPARSFGASRLQTFTHVLVPAVIPDVFVGLRLAAGNAVLVLVGIEFVQGGAGLGWMIWNSWQLFAADRMYVGIVAVAVVGVVFQSLIQFIGQRLTPWITARH